MNITVIGAGTYSETVIELAQMLGYCVTNILDDDPLKIGLKIMGVPISGTISELLLHETLEGNYVVTIGNNTIRRRIGTRIRKLGGNTITLIHPKATISSSSSIGNGVIIQAGALIWTKSKIDDDVIISPNAAISHHSRIGGGVLISMLSSVGSFVNVGKEAFIGMGATIMTGVNSIGSNAIVGAGAVVIRNVEENDTVVGVPAKSTTKDNLS